MSSSPRHVITPSIPEQGHEDQTVLSPPYPGGETAAVLYNEEHVPEDTGHMEQATGTYGLPLALPHRIQPALSAHDLEYALMSSSTSDDDDEATVELGQDLGHHFPDDAYASDHNEDLYMPGFDLLGQRASDAMSAEGSIGQRQDSASLARREGGTSKSAILIQDSPTPPLRPLASPEARMVASVSGRCGILDGDNHSAITAEADKQVTLGDLVCPVCLGPPAPLVATVCGHTFCGPCLHASITNQTITPQLLQEIPGLTGKELEGTCPVCRTVLAGGWGGALRGAIIKMDNLEVEI